jgi:hypothetical protein
MDDFPWYPAAAAIGVAGKKKNRFGAYLLTTSIVRFFLCRFFLDIFNARYGTMAECHIAHIVVAQKFSIKH